jgi:PAS domain S-box-containing protein
MINVLFVDDEPDIIEVAKLYLEKDPDIRVSPAHSAISALEKIQEMPFDVIVSDHEMPDLDGIAFLNRLKREGCEIPFIMYTGRSREKVVIEALNSGAFFLLQKGDVSPRTQFLEMRDVILKAVGRRRALEKLKESEERYRTLAESAHDAIFILDPQGVLKYVNTYGAMMLGRESGQLVGKTIPDFFPADIAQEFNTHLEKVYRSVTPFSHISRIPGKQGIIWLETWLVPLLDKDHRVFELMGRSRDISERMVMEEALRASEMKFRTLLDQAADALFLTEPTTGKILEVNRQALSITGMSQEELVRKTIPEILRDSDREAWNRYILDSRENSATVLSDISIIGRPHHEIPVDITCTYVAIGDDAYNQVVIRDVTERNRTMMLLKQQQQQLEATNHELEAFAYSVSHDLRAPARVIEGYATILLDKFGGDAKPEMKYIIERVMTATKKMQNLITDLLRLSRVNKADFRSEPVDLTSMARGIVADLRSEDPERVVDVFVSPDMVIEGDKALLEVMLRNLIGNAWKYTSRKDNPRIEIREERSQNGTPVFVVRDNGAGFDAASASDLFAPFKRFHAESDFSGIGIGLAIVQRIVHRHGGTVWAESMPGKGAAFFFSFP